MALAVILTTLLIWLVVGLRCVALLPLGRGWRVLLALALLPLAEYWLLVAWYWGSFNFMEMPRWAVIALGGGLGTLLMLALQLLARDLLGLLLWPLRRAASRVLLRGRALNLGLALATVLLGVWGTAQAIRLPAAKPVEIAVPGLPAAFDGYRIALLSDLHASPLNRAPWVRGVVERTNALRADLIVIAGDFQDGTVAARADDVAPLRALHAPDGVVGAPGNHEYYTSYPAWMAALRALGITMLENQHLLIARGGARLALAGLTDPQARAFGQPAPNLRAALAGIPHGVPVIVISHRPGNAPEVARAGAALELAGHTHGGQIRGPDLVTKFANHGFLAGLYEVAGMPLYVSSGSGLWHGLPMRVGHPAEITAITLRAQPR